MTYERLVNLYYSRPPWERFKHVWGLTWAEFVDVWNLAHVSYPGVESLHRQPRPSDATGALVLGCPVVIIPNRWMEI